MTISRSELRAVAATQVNINDDTFAVGLDDGRTITVPLAWYPRLLHGSAEERGNWQLIGKGEGIHWPDLDEDISVDHLLLGLPSGETQRSLKAWLEQRGQGSR